MNAYEVMLTLDPAMKKEDMDALIQEVEAEISKNGKVVEVQRIGRRKLEHPIAKQPEGYFVQINFESEPQAINKMTAKYNLKENILRFFFVRRDDGFVKFKSFDENAAYADNYSHGGGYSGDAGQGRGGY